MGLDGNVLWCRYVYLEKEWPNVCLRRQMVRAFLPPVNLKAFSWQVKLCCFVLRIIGLMQGVKRRWSAALLPTVAAKQGKREVSFVAFFSCSH